MAKSENVTLFKEMISDENLAKTTNSVWVERNLQWGTLDVYLLREGVHNGKAQVLQGIFELVEVEPGGHLRAQLADAAYPSRDRQAADDPVVEHGGAP